MVHVNKLIITRGAPGSGKTTWAKGWVAESEGTRARVNRDDVRLNAYGRGAPLPPELEKGVTAFQVGAVEALLSAGIDVVVDDTNISSKYVTRWAEVASRHHAEFLVQSFASVPLATCLDRNAARSVSRVPDQVVRDMHHRLIQSLRSSDLSDILSESKKPLPTTSEPYRYEMPPFPAPGTWLVDIDGTLAHMGDRSPFEWHKVGYDTPNPSVVNFTRMVNVIGQAATIMSGRDEVCRQKTERWLHEHGVPFRKLHMRAAGDQRKDAIVKLELFREHVAPNYRVHAVLDDRQQVVDMWRSIGLSCWQVAPGDF